MIPNWILFELAATKLLHYTLPLLPALTLLIGCAIRQRFGMASFGMASDDSSVHGSSLSSGYRWLVVGSLTLGTLINVGFPIGILMLLTVTGEGFDSFTAIVLVAVAVGMVVALIYCWRLQITRGLACILMTLIPFYAIVYHHILPGADSLWISRQVRTAVIDQSTCPDSIVASVGYSEPSLIFLLGTNTRILHDVSTAILHLEADPACHPVLVEASRIGVWEDELATLIPHVLPPLVTTTIRGFNYNKGQVVELILYSVDPNSDGRPSSS